MGFSTLTYVTKANTFDRVEELENKIGAGLIEEVIQVAESELHLVDIMKKSQAYVVPPPLSLVGFSLTFNPRWESLEEKPQEGQWVYFERKE